MTHTPLPPGYIPVEEYWEQYWDEVYEDEYRHRDHELERAIFVPREEEENEED